MLHRRPCEACFPKSPDFALPDFDICTLLTRTSSNPMWDTSLFRFLSLKVKGDDRRYYINIQTDSLDPIELWQHRLFLRTPGQWETVLIPWADFLRTRNGRISYKKFDGMDRERVKTVGTSLIERKEGPFCLHVAEIKVLTVLPRVCCGVWDCGFGISVG